MNPGQVEKLVEAMKALYSGGPLSPAELAEFDRLRAAETARHEQARSVSAKFKDLLEFAAAYGLTGTPKYQREAAKCLERAIEMIGSDPETVIVSETDADGTPYTIEIPADEYRALRDFG